MSQVLHLYRLQKIDSQRDQVLARLNAIERALEEDESLRNARSAKAAAEQSLLKADSDLHQAEEAVKNQRIKIELNEASLYGGKVHNPKELQDLQNEVASLKRYLATLEDRQLDAMLVYEEIESQHKAGITALAQAEAQVLRQHTSLLTEKEHLLHDLIRIEAERSVAASPIPVPLLTRYDQLRVQKKGIAITTIDDEACSVCGSELTPAERQAARSHTQISQCPSCGRIIYAG